MRRLKPRREMPELKFRAVAILLAILLFGVGIKPLSAVDSADLDDGFAAPESTEFGYHHVIFREQSSFEETFSWLKSVTGLTCEDSRGNCGQLGGPFRFHALLQPCTAISQIDCIESLSMITNESITLPGSYVRPFPNSGRNDYPADFDMALPSGGPGGIWQFPNLYHAGGQDFFLRVGVSGSEVIGKFKIQGFHAEVIGVEDIAAPCTEFGKMYCGPRFDTYDERAAGTMLDGVLISPWLGQWSEGKSDCVMTGNSRCLQRRGLISDPQFKLVIRLHNSPAGWLHGRISDSQIRIEPLSNNGEDVRIVFSGKSVKVPVVTAGDLYGNLPENLKLAYRNGGFKDSPWSTRDFGCTRCADPNTRNLLSVPYPYGQSGMDELLQWLPLVNNTATANLSSWSVRSLTTIEMAGSNSCLNDSNKLAGFVTTNATQYSAGPPTFDKSAGSLEYQVAAPHYTSGGNVFTGTYDLLMRSDVARCLYGFSKAPLNASISVIDNDGVSTAATKLVSEKDGWLQIAAYGFGFSNPTIKVNLSQASSPTTTKTVVSKTTITCKKGKAVKKITGLKPVCPKGYKKLS